MDKLIKLSEDIIDILGIEDDEVFMLKNTATNTIFFFFFRHNNFGIEYFYAPYDGWQECATPNLTEILNGSFEIVKCKPRIYSHELDILRR